MSHIDKARRKFEPYHDAHSALLGYNEVGVCVVNETKTWCYSYVFRGVDLQISRLFIYFGADLIKNSNHGAKWADWIINRSMFATAFITKDVAEGFEIGFEVDTSVDRYMMQSGMLALRHAFEFPGWSWWDFIELGFSPEHSYALAANVTLDGGLMWKAAYGSPHLVIPSEQNLDVYLGKRFVKVDNEQNLMDGADFRISMSKRWGCNTDYVHLNVPVVEATKENCEDLLEKMRKI